MTKTERRIREDLLERFQIENPSEGSYIKWFSPWTKRSCTGRFVKIEYGRIVVKWLWNDKWVKGTVDPKNVIDLQDRRYHGYGS